MHVAIVCRGLGRPGSVAAVALRQGRELSRHGSVTLISDSLPEAPWATRWLAPVRDLDILRRFRHVPDEILFVRAVRRALLAVHARQPIDFVLGHSHAVAHLAARRFRETEKVPFGFFIHGDINDRPEGTYDSRLTAFYQWVTPRAYRSADVVFALSNPFAETARRAGARDVETIPNGIDPQDIGLDDPISPSAIREEGEALRLLYVGRLSVEKGLTHLLDACSLVDENYVLDIVGGGPLEAPLQAAIDARKLGSRVRLIGTVPRLELGSLYRRSHVFCTPTLSEPFASVITEALVSGLPVIGTTVGGIPEVVEHESNGLLVPPADPLALAAAITRLSRDEPLRRSLAANARSSVLPRLSWEGIGDRIAGVIRRVAR